MRSKITDFFVTILQLPPEDINDETTPDDIAQWDSFKHMMLISSFEEEFDISIEPEEIVDMYKSYGEFKSTVLAKLK